MQICNSFSVLNIWTRKLQDWAKNRKIDWVCESLIHICGKSAILINFVSVMIVDLRFAGLICGPPTFLSPRVAIGPLPFASIQWYNTATWVKGEILASSDTVESEEQTRQCLKNHINMPKCCKYWAKKSSSENLNQK